MNTLFANLLIVAITVLAGPNPLDPNPLTENQWTRVETADDDSGTIDESAFYALLENASKWSDSEVGAIVPDYTEIRSDPEKWRGQRCLIEGELFLVVKPVLTRPGWENVRGLVIRTDFTTEKARGPQDFVIVYVTDPPAFTWDKQEVGLPWEAGSMVRVAARFFKRDQFDSLARHGEGVGRSTPKVTYSLFAGHTATLQQKNQIGTSAETSNLILFAVLAVGAVAYMVYRAHKMRVGSGGGSKLQEYLEKRAQERSQTRRESGETEPAIELPEDPAEALKVLSGRMPSDMSEEAPGEPATEESGSPAPGGLPSFPPSAPTP